MYVQVYWLRMRTARPFKPPPLGRSSVDRRRASFVGDWGCGLGAFPETDYERRSWNTRACSSVGWVYCMKMLLDGPALIWQRLRHRVPISSSSVSKLYTGRS